MSLFQTAAALEREGERTSWRNNSFFFTQSKCTSSQIVEDKTSNWKETKQNKTPNHMIHSKNWQNNTRFGHHQNVTKQQTTAIISKLTFRVAQIRILSHFSSCHALFATPNLDASAVLLLRLSSTPENKKWIEGETKKICWNSFLRNDATSNALLVLVLVLLHASSRRSRKANKQTNKPNKNNRFASFVATLNVSTPPNPPNSRLQFFWSSVGSFANNFCLIFFLFFPFFWDFLLVPFFGTIRL